MGGYRARQGLVPGFCFPRLSDQCPRALAELKGITLAKAHYPRVRNTHGRSAGAACASRASLIGA